MKSETLKKKIVDFLGQGFLKDANNMTDEQLRNAVAESSMLLEKEIDVLKGSDEVKQAKENLSDVSAPYKEAVMAAKLQLKYYTLLLSEKK